MWGRIDYGQVPTLYGGLELDMNKELNEFMAVNVMRWDMGTHAPTMRRTYPAYFDNNGFIMLVANWHPDTDLNQAMMCADKVKEQHLFADIDIGHEILRLYNMKNGSYITKEYDGIEELPLAICEAIKQAVEV